MKSCSKMTGSQQLGGTFHFFFKQSTIIMIVPVIECKRPGCVLSDTTTPATYKKSCTCSFCFSLSLECLTVCLLVLCWVCYISSCLLCMLHSRSHTWVLQVVSTIPISYGFNSFSFVQVWLTTATSYALWQL